MTRIKSLIRCIAFVLAALFCIKGAIRILVPKNYTGEWLSPVPSYCGFYELKKDTVDVLFLGSSHTYASFCPQVIFFLPFEILLAQRGAAYAVAFGCGRRECICV